MPKMKTHKGAAKRFKKTSSGKIRRRRANKKHILEKKSPKRKRQARRPAVIADGDEARVRRMLGI